MYWPIGKAYTPRAFVSTIPSGHPPPPRMTSTPAEGTWSQRRLGVRERSVGSRWAINPSRSVAASASTAAWSLPSVTRRSRRGDTARKAAIVAASKS